jgi:hypothetical protein
MNTIYQAAEINKYYVFFALILLLSNSLVKFFFDDLRQDRTRQLVFVTSVIVNNIFWLFGLSLWKLIFITFAVFGFFDFFGRRLEIAYMRLIVVLMYYTNALYNIIKNFIVSLIAKIKSKLKSK